MADEGLAMLAAAVLPKPDRTFRGEILCSGCGTVLARTSEPVYESEKEWVESMRIWRAGQCPKGCNPRTDGLNFHEWHEIVEGDAS